MVQRLDLAERPGAAPAGRSLPDVLEQASLAAADVGNLDQGAAMGLGIETGEAALFAADLPFVADPIAGG
jgi:hypothetical protein